MSTNPQPTRYSRDKLIALCEAGVVPVEKWGDRDTARAQQKLGEAWCLLRAGCDFKILRGKTPHGLCTNDQTVWIEITFPGFAEFDYDGGYEREMYYLPTEARLEFAAGGDWY